MVVDDDPGIHEALRLTLDDHYEVHSASGGAEALQDLARRHVDLVLLDLLMPGVDGWQVFDRIRLMAPRPKIVFLTAVDRSEAAVTALQSGADDWIVKPFEEPALLTRLHSLLHPPPPVILRGGHVGIRATVAVALLSRHGVPVDYRMPASGDTGVVDVDAGRDEAGLAALLGRPPVSLTGLSPAIRTVLYRVSIRFSESTVGDLASAAMLSSGSLWERFRREIGVPPVEFLVRVRVEVIKQRLCDPGVRLSSGWRRRSAFATPRTCAGPSSGTSTSRRAGTGEICKWTGETCID
jgi:CheY-like chemotaxis protein